MQGSHTDQSEFELLRVLGSKEVGEGHAFAALIVTEDHPTVGDQWRVIRLSQQACKSVFERLFHRDKILGDFLFQLLLTEEGPGGSKRGVVPLNGIRCYRLLSILLQDFCAIPDEFVSSISEDDTAETVAMLQGKEASGSASV